MARPDEEYRPSENSRKIATVKGSGKLAMRFTTANAQAVGGRVACILPPVKFPSENFKVLSRFPAHSRLA